MSRSELEAQDWGANDDLRQRLLIEAKLEAKLDEEITLTLTRNEALMLERELARWVDYNSGRRRVSDQASLMHRLRTALLDKEEEVPMSLRPLSRIGKGAWKSRDGRWTFLRHFSDPQPHRWFAYLDEGEFPANEGTGITTLTGAVEWATRQRPDPPPED